MADFDAFFPFRSIDAYIARVRSSIWVVLRSVSATIVLCAIRTIAGVPAFAPHNMFAEWESVKCNLFEARTKYGDRVRGLLADDVMMYKRNGPMHFDCRSQPSFARGQTHI